MTKAEMEAHRGQYQARVAEASAAEEAGMFREAVTRAMSSLEHIDGTMQYERKYEGAQFANVEGIDLVLRYAPILFDFESLDKLESLLKTQRRIAKNSSDDLLENLASARELMWDAHRIWNDLEQRSLSSQDDATRNSPRENDARVIETWKRMGLLHQRLDGASCRFAFTTEMEGPAFAKCPACGAVAKAPKRTLLNEVMCPKCGGKVVFVMLARET